MSIIVNLPLDDESVVAGQTQVAWAGSVDQDCFLNALRDHDIPQSVWPSRPKDTKCLGRALEAVRTNRKDRVESLHGNGWVLTMVDTEKLDLENPDNDGRSAHTVSLTAKVIKEVNSSYLRFTPSEHLAVPLVRNQYDYERTRFHCATDLSQWFSRTIIPWCNGVAARSRGGSWYVAKGEGLNRLQKVQEALHSVSQFNVQTISVRGSEETLEVPKVSLGGMVTIEPRAAELGAIRTLLSRLITETEEVCDEMHATLTSGQLKKRGLTYLNRRACTLEDKLEQYSQALGVDLADIVERLDEIKGGIGMAELALDA